jgi:hypothetical protein
MSDPTDAMKAPFNAIAPHGLGSAHVAKSDADENVGPYRVEEEWAGGASYGDEEDAEHEAACMNLAYQAGRKTAASGSEGSST